MSAKEINLTNQLLELAEKKLPSEFEMAKIEAGLKAKHGVNLEQIIAMGVEALGSMEAVVDVLLKIDRKHKAEAARKEIKPV